MAATIREIQTALDKATRAGNMDAVIRLTQILEKARAAGMPEGEMPWSEVGSRAIRNLPSSAGKFVDDLTTAVTNPIDTITTLGDLGAGAIREGARAMLPTPMFNAIDSLGNQDSANKASDVATAVGRMYRDRYGSMDGFKRAIAEDPVSVSADLALPVGGAGSVAARTPGFARIGRAVQTTANLMDPVSAAGMALRSGGRAVSGLAGFTSGMGDEPARSIFNARRAGGPQAAAANRGMRQPPDAEGIVTQAMDKAGVLADEARARYRTGIAATNSSAARINWNNIFRTMYDTIQSNMTTRGGRFYGGPTGRQMVQEILGTVQQYVMDPALHNLEGLDALKQELSQLQHPVGANPVRGAENANRLVTSVIDGIRQEINRLEPSYANVEADYARFKDLQSELRNALSLNDKASTDTAMRKLQSTMRNNVQTNYGARTQNLDILDSVDRGNLRPGTLRAELAGQAANSPMPRGIARAGGAMAVPAFLSWLASSPGLATLTALMAPMASPRVVGEVAGLLGDMAGYGNRIAAATPQPLVDAATAATSRTARTTARQGGAITNEVLLEDAKGNVYDSKGRLIRRASQ